MCFPRLCSSSSTVTRRIAALASLAPERFGRGEFAGGAFEHLCELLPLHCCSSPPHARNFGLAQNILEREVARYDVEHIRRGTALGELDHPNYASKYFKCLNLPNVSHQVCASVWAWVQDRVGMGLVGGWGKVRGTLGQWSGGGGKGKEGQQPHAAPQGQGLNLPSPYTSWKAGAAR